MTPLVSVIIVNFNTRQLTLDCVKSVYTHTAGVPFEVIVVDNASSDDSVAAIRKTFPDVMVIENKTNIGFGPANNTGIRAATAPYVFLLNSDTILENNVIRYFLDHLERPENARVACCGGQLLNADGSPQASFGHFPSIAQVWFDQLEMRRLFRRYYTSHLAVAVNGPLPSLPNVPYLSGATMFIRKTALETVGGFDEHYFLYFEETDLCFRFRKAGWDCHFVPEARITHFFGQSSKGQSLSRMRAFKKSELFFFEKNRGKMTRFLVRVLYIKGYTLRWILTWNTHYLDLLRIVLIA